MYKSSTEIKIGLFVIVGLLLMGWMAFKIGGFNSSNNDGYELTARFPNAGGLKPGVSVEVAGIQMGRVRSVRLVDNQAEVVIVVSRGVILPNDSQAAIRSQGVLGDKYVELTPGAKGNPPLVHGDRIANTATPTDMGELLEKLGSIADDIKKVTSAISEDDGGEDIRRAINNFADMSERLAAIVRDNQEGLTSAIHTFSQSAAKFEDSMTSLQSITKKIDSGQGTLGKLINDDSTIRELNQSLQSVRQIAGKIDSGQGTLGKLVNDDTTIKKLDNALGGISDYLAKEQAFKIYVDYRADYQTRHDYLKSTINVRIQPAPDRYYLLGVSTDYFGKYKRVDHVDTGPGGTVTTKRESWERDKLKFNAQIARRYYDLVIRAGLIESGGGLGFDYYLLEDQLKITFEAFSADFDHNPHLRLMASYNFWKIFYVSLGYDDFISDQHRASPFVGIGLRLSDDDLKYLFSSLPRAN